jgi:hypothetical protein
MHSGSAKSANSVAVCAAASGAALPPFAPAPTREGWYTPPTMDAPTASSASAAAPTTSPGTASAGASTMRSSTASTCEKARWEAKQPAAMPACDLRMAASTATASGGGTPPPRPPPTSASVNPSAADLAPSRRRNRSTPPACMLRVSTTPALSSSNTLPGPSAPALASNSDDCTRSSDSSPSLLPPSPPAPPPSPPPPLAPCACPPAASSIPVRNRVAASPVLRTASPRTITPGAPPPPLLLTPLPLPPRAAAPAPPPPPLPLPLPPRSPLPSDCSSTSRVLAGRGCPTSCSAPAAGIKITGSLRPDRNSYKRQSSPVVVLAFPDITSSAVCRVRGVPPGATPRRSQNRSSCAQLSRLHASDAPLSKLCIAMSLS